jgi:hypothetical protein
MPSNAEDLYQYVERTFPDAVDLVYEAGCCGFSAARYFKLGLECLLILRCKERDKERYQKTDALDSKLVQSIKIRCSKRCFIPTEEHEQFTTLARHRTQVTKKLRQTKSHIKSMLLFHGIKVPDEFDNSNWTIAFIAWLEEIKFSTSCGDLALQEKYACSSLSNQNI